MASRTQTLSAPRPSRAIAADDHDVYEHPKIDVLRLRVVSNHEWKVLKNLVNTGVLTEIRQLSLHLRMEDRTMWEEYKTILTGGASPNSNRAPFCASFNESSSSTLLRSVRARTCPHVRSAGFHPHYVQKQTARRISSAGGQDAAVHRVRQLRQRARDAAVAVAAGG